MHTTHLTRISAHKYIRINECSGLYWTMHTCSRSYATKHSLRPMSYVRILARARIYAYTRIHWALLICAMCACIPLGCALWWIHNPSFIYIYLRAVCAYSRESARVKPYVYVSIYNQSYSRIRTYTRVYAGIRAYACMHICMHMRVHAGITHINALTRAVRSRKLR